MKFRRESQREKFGQAGRIFTLPSNAIESERGCVVLDEPQQVGKAGRVQFVSMATQGEAVAAGLRHGRAPGPRGDGRVELRFAIGRQPVKLP
jgi:hypothetical protein